MSGEGPGDGGGEERSKREIGVEKGYVTRPLFLAFFCTKQFFSHF